MLKHDNRPYQGLSLNGDGMLEPIITTTSEQGSNGLGFQGKASKEENNFVLAKKFKFKS